MVDRGALKASGREAPVWVRIPPPARRAIGPWPLAARPSQTSDLSCRAARAFAGPEQRCCIATKTVEPTGARRVCRLRAQTICARPSFTQPAGHAGGMCRAFNQRELSNDPGATVRARLRRRVAGNLQRLPACRATNICSPASRSRSTHRLLRAAWGRASSASDAPQPYVAEAARLGPNRRMPNVTQKISSASVAASTGTAPIWAINGTDAAVNSPPPTTGSNSSCL